MRQTKRLVWGAILIATAIFNSYAGNYIVSSLVAAFAVVLLGSTLKKELGL